MRTNPLELFDRFQAQATNLLVSNTFREKAVFQFAHLSDLHELFLNITLVLDLDLHLFGHLVGQFRALRVEGREVLVADLRAADEVGGVRRFPAVRCRAPPASG